IVWLYRGQRDRFLALVQDYLGRVCAEARGAPATLGRFEATLADLRGRFDALAKAAAKHEALVSAVAELSDATKLYAADAKKLLRGLDAFVRKYAKALPEKNDAQHAA